jgi:hypothetical protein
VVPLHNPIQWMLRMIPIVQQTQPLHATLDRTLPLASFQWLQIMLTTGGMLLRVLTSTLCSIITNCSHATLTCRTRQPFTADHPASTRYRTGARVHTKSAEVNLARIPIECHPSHRSDLTMSRTFPAISMSTLTSGSLRHLPASYRIPVITETSRSTCIDVHRICHLGQRSTNPKVSCSTLHRLKRLGRVLWSRVLREFRDPPFNTGLRVALVTNASSRHLLNRRDFRVNQVAGSSSRFPPIYKWSQP